jgi:antitoxin (DNA-binding transcriptional repressor) of toxin-antitoxin stability system
VPEAIRDQVIERAVAGEHITKAKAEEMVADAVATAKRQTAEEKEREFREAYAKWEAAQPKKLKQETPDVKTIRRDLCKVLDRKDLTADQWRWLAQILGETIAVGNRQYQPVSKAEIAANEENLRIASAITVAFETLAGAPPPVALKAATWPVQRKQHKRVGPQIIAWLTEYMAVLEGED